MPTDYFQMRLAKLRSRLRKKRLDALLITGATNVRYISGFTGDDSWFVSGREEAALLTDSRYTEQAQSECAHCEVIERKGSMRDTCLKYLKARTIRTVGFEADSISYGEWQRLQGGPAEWRPTSGLVEDLRLIKDAGEIKNIRQAAAIAEECFESIREWIRPGVTEGLVANEIENMLRRLGASASSFETIVLFGQRSSLPHGRPGRRVLRPGEPVLIDWGARLGLYNSDLTRMLLPSTISTKLERIYKAVLEAQQAAIDAARPGMAAGDLDAVARNRLKRARLGRRFGHGLGHGVGMEVHEAPTIRQASGAELRPGMVFTIEPGAYMPGWGGVRIEDMIQLTRKGRRVLTSLPKKLEDVCVL